MRDFAPNGFSPLSSGPRTRVPPSFLQEFLIRTSPKLFANDVQVAAVGLPFAETLQLVQVLQVTLPCPAPVAILLQAQAAGGGRFEPTSAIPAEATELGEFGQARGSGRFIVEWGTGEARGHLFTDLTPGSVQLPSAIYVAIFAFLEAGPAQLASAAVMPDAVFSDPRATFTSTVVTQFSGDFQVQRQPFARAISIDFATSDDGLPFPGQLDVLGNWQDLTVARWVLPEPLRPDEQSTPVPVSEVPLAGNVDNFTLRFSGLPEAPPDVLASLVGAGGEPIDGTALLARAVLAVAPPYAAANLAQTIKV